MRKKVILLGLIGYVVGCLIGLFFCLQKPSFSLMESLPDILLGGIPGAIASASTFIYEIEEWSILRATLTHFGITMGVIILACFVLHWFQPWSPAFWILLAIETVGYFIIWIILYMHYKKEVQKLNELLKKNSESEE